MKSTRVLGAVVFTVVAGYGVALYAGEEHRSALFKEYCAKCHGEDGRRRPLRASSSWRYDFTDADSGLRTDASHQDRDRRRRTCRLRQEAFGRTDRGLSR